MIIVGVTGGIASGKTTVTRLLGELGAQTGSADADARAVLEDGSATLAQVLQAFPRTRLPDGALDRAALAAHIFADATARARLEAILHPPIVARMGATITRARAAGPGVLVYETPLLYEAALDNLFDVVVALVATPDVQAARLQERERAAGRDPLSDDELAARFHAQIPPEEKARRADFVIRTGGSIEETTRQVRDLWKPLSPRARFP